MKPYEIVTVEGLDSLPRLSIIADPVHAAYQKRWHVQEGFKVDGWFCTSDCEYAHESDEIALPVTVLYHPRGKA